MFLIYYYVLSLVVAIFMLNLLFISMYLLWLYAEVLFTSTFIIIIIIIGSRISIQRISHIFLLKDIFFNLSSSLKLLEEKAITK